MISRLFRTSFLMLSVFLFSFIARASDGRIQPGGDPVVRCMGQGLPADKCKAMQDYALQIGCVTPGEYAAVVRYGFAPTCSPVKGPGLEQLASYCPCGCFHPDTLISVREWSSGEDGLIEAGVLVDSRNDFGLIHLSNTSRMSQLTQKASPILVTTAGKEKKDLVVIKTTSGKLLKLTEQHAVLTDGGIMKAAVDILHTDKLVRESGEAESILEISRESYEGDVVNFTVDADDPKEHIIFAEGLAVGDLLWQSSLQDLKNRVTVRE